jgi:hypothetical protein
MGTTKRALKAKRPKRVDRRKTTSTRITPETRAYLEEGAAQSGRSLSQEIELRLERSFVAGTEAVRGVYTSFGDMRTFIIMRMLASAISAIEAKVGSKWTEDPEAFEQVEIACLALLKVFGPKGSVDLTEKTAAIIMEKTEGKYIGAEVATAIFTGWLEQMQSPNALLRHKEAEQALAEADGD